MSRLSERVEQYNIPRWPGQAVFGEIIIYRLPDEASSRKTFDKNGTIEMPDNVAANKKFRSPRGIIVSAGLLALDTMASHGIQLGSIVWMASNSPYRFEVDVIDGKSVEFFFMNVADIRLDEDLLKALESGELRIEKNKDGQHSFQGEKRVDPPLFGDSI